MNRIVWIAFLTALNWTAVTQGAPINWGRVKDVSSSTEVINRGTLIEAFNAGGTTSGRDQTVNGVLFTGTSALLSQARDQDVFSRDTGDAAYNALLSSMDTGGGTDLVSLEVGGGKLSVGTEYRIQVWWAADQASSVVPVVVGDGESSANTVTLKSTPGQFTIGSFIADGNTQTITLESPDFGDTYLTAYQIRDRATAEVTAEEMRDHSKRHLSKFPEYSWDKVTRWAYARKGINKKWKKEEIDIMGTRCKYIWIQEDSEECNNFKKAYPNKMYCFSYINLEKVYHKPNPFEPSYFLYGKNGGTSTYSSGQMKYNHANPDCRRWWLDFIADCGYSEPKSDVIFVDSIQKILRIAAQNYYDSAGVPVSKTYIEQAAVPLLESLRNELSKDFIIQGNFLRANTSYTANANMDYVTNYTTSVYLEGFETQEHMHKTIESVQQAVDLGMMVAPNFSASSTCENLEEARAAASAAMPTFWARLDTAEQDVLAAMYSSFDFKLAYFLIMAGEHSYMRCSNAVVVDRAGTDLFKIVPPFPEFDRKLGAPLSDGVRVSDSTWEREFEYCKVTLNVDAETADFDWSFRSDDQAEDMAVGKPVEQFGQAGVLYQSDFTGADLGSAGLTATAGVNGTWILDAANDQLSGKRTGSSPRSNVYTTESWQYNYGMTLHVTFNQEISGSRHSIGIVDADYTVTSGFDCFNSGMKGAYGIGYSATADALIFNDGTQGIKLSTGQGANTPSTIETTTITVTADSYSYSLNGAEPTTGLLSFDTSRAFRFVAFAQDVDEQYISNITLEPATAVTDWWEVDLEAIREIGNIDVWPGPSGVSDFYVLVSTDPFQTHDLDSTLAQPGVTAIKVDGQCGTPTSIPFNTAGRYVRVQSTTTGSPMNLAKVQVWSAPPLDYTAAHEDL